MQIDSEVAESRNEFWKQTRTANGKHRGSKGECNVAIEPASVCTKLGKNPTKAVLEAARK